MKTIKCIMSLGFLVFWAACGGSDDDMLDPSDGNGEGNSGVINGTPENPIMGSWYEATSIGTHTLFRFKEDGAYDYWYRSDEVMRHEEGFYKQTPENLVLTTVDGKKKEYEIIHLSQTEFKFRTKSLQYDLRSSTLVSLEEGCAPSTVEAGLSMRYFHNNKGGVSVVIIPHYGVHHYYYVLGKQVSETDARGNGVLEKSFTDLKLGTTYTVTAMACDVHGNTYKPVSIQFTTKGKEGMVNYFVCDGEYYELGRAEMSQKHGHSGTGTSANRKMLSFYNSDETYLRFEYAVPEWEGIDKEWVEGTYSIRNSSGYYTYSAVLVIDGKVQHYVRTGKLVIKKNGDYYTFDFDLTDVAGHFEGKIQ